MIKLLVFIFCLNPLVAKEPQYVYIHGRILNSLVKDLSNKYSLEIYGRGGSFMKNVKSFSVSFYHRFPISISSAEKLFVDISNDILNKYNNCSEIRPFLDIYPFDSSRVDLHITFPNNTKNGEIESISRFENDVIYRFHSSNGFPRREREKYKSLYESVYGQSEKGLNFSQE